MALRAGYKGVKNDMIAVIKSLAELGIKSLGTMFNVSNKGLLTVKKATASAPGIVQPDGTTITVNNGIISGASGGGDYYNTEPTESGECLDMTIYTRAIQFYKDGSVDSEHWTSGGGTYWQYDGISAGDIDCILEYIILNQDSGGVYSLTTGTCAFDNSTGLFNLSYTPGYNNYLLLKYFVNES